ncbi:MAG: hypothetical protein MJ142_03080 [Clostridia bacterium]|nr:hypothetical protein [Clostridia bacterium]
MRNRIGILVHFNLNSKPLAAITIAKYLLEMLSVIVLDGSSYKIVMETRITDSFSSEKTEMTDLEFSIDEIIKHIDPSVCYISINICNSKGVCASSYGSIVRSSGLTQPMIGHEQAIFTLVNADLWKKRAEPLIKKIKDMCSDAPHITYVAIDKENISPKSIYIANIRLFSNPYSASAIDPESRIPGIYWAQYINNSMLDQNIRKRISEGICSTPDIICEEIGTGFWIQTAPAIQADSIDHQKAACKILEIETQSYVIDENIIRSYRKLEPFLFEKFPLI